MKSIFCNHRIVFSRNIFGDEINKMNARSVFLCKKCGRKFLSDKLIDEDSIYRYGAKFNK